MDTDVLLWSFKSRKLFRVDRIKNLKKLGGTFDEAKPLFNPTGDKDMIKIYNITQFD